MLRGRKRPTSPESKSAPRGRPAAKTAAAATDTRLGGAAVPTSAKRGRLLRSHPSAAGTVLSGRKDTVSAGASTARAPQAQPLHNAAVTAKPAAAAARRTFLHTARGPPTLAAVSLSLAGQRVPLQMGVASETARSPPKLVLPPDFDPIPMNAHLVKLSCLVRDTDVGSGGGSPALLTINAAVVLALPPRKVGQLADALAATLTATHEAPGDAERNPYTCFSTRWHAPLAALSDSELAAAWKLSDYLMLDADCGKPIAEVMAQRVAAATGAGTSRSAHLFSADQWARVEAVLTGWRKLAEGWDILPESEPASEDLDTLVFSDCMAAGGPRSLRLKLALGKRAPTSTADGLIAARFGQLANIQAARSRRVLKWHEAITTTAAQHGHLPTLQWCVGQGCPLSKQKALAAAQKNKHEHVVEWLTLLHE